VQRNAANRHLIACTDRRRNAGRGGVRTRTVRARGRITPGVRPL